tara:strand:+ start:48 stop:443 length:396 start_codon:yes stop_codon:yes gene_type:complete
MKKKDLDYVARLERAIKEKYGDDTIQNPAKYWDKDKEKEYLEQLKELVTKQKTSETISGFDNVDGILISRKLINKEALLNCPTCKNKIKTINDDIYIIKYECCNKCYINYVEGRENRWLQGWRPEDVRKNT